MPPHDDGQAPPPEGTGAVSVRCVQSQKGMEICIVDAAGGKRNLNRDQDELLEKTLGRLRSSLAGKPKKKKKGATPDSPREGGGDSAGLVIAILGGEGPEAAPLDPTTVTNREAWSEGNTLKVGEALYPIIVNSPTVLDVFVASRPMVGYPILPVPEVEFCRPEDLEYTWLRVRAKPRSSSGSEGSKSPPPPSPPPGDREAEEVVAIGRCYTPSPRDVGHTLRVECSPPGAGPGRKFSAAVYGPVRKAPPRAPALERLQFPRPPASGDGAVPFRVCTYNVLADQYSHTWETLYPYFPRKFHTPNYRFQLALEDIRILGADIVALQEVDAKWYDLFWRPHMAASGYSGMYTCKADLGNSGKGSREGSALFIKDEAFEVVATRDLRPGKGLATCSDPRMAELVSGLPNLAEILDRITTVAQLAVLRPRAGGGGAGLLCVANTHLFFHPRATHVRMIQAAHVLHEAEKLGREADACGGAALVLCGDLNGEPQDGVIEFLKSGNVSAAHPEWAVASFFHWGLASSRNSNRKLLRKRTARQIAEEREAEMSTPSGRYEMYARMRACFHVLEDGVEADDDEAGASSNGGGGSGGGGNGAEECEVDGEGCEPGPAARELLMGGATFKTSAAIAAYQLRRDAGMPAGLDTDGPAGAEARAAVAALGARVEEDVAAAVAHQAALAEAAMAAGGDGVAGVGMELKSPYALESAWGAEDPPYTNYVKGFVGALDWVFVQAGRVRVAGATGVPPPEVVTKDEALPSGVFPSDHLPMAADLELVAPPPV